MNNCNITGNGVYAFYAAAESAEHIVYDATDNWWGTTNASAIEAMVCHQTDSPYLATVTYMPCAQGPIDINDSLPTDADELGPQPLPDNYHLAQNFPNPFNAATQIRFDLPRSGRVRLDVYNVLGQHVTALIDDVLPAGSHAVAWTAESAASGVYFYRLQTEKATLTRKMVLLR